MPDVSKFMLFVEWFHSVFMDSVTADFGVWIKTGFKKFSSCSATVYFGCSFTQKGAEALLNKRKDAGCNIIRERSFGSKYGIKNDEAGRAELRKEILEKFPGAVIQSFEESGSGCVKVTVRIPFVDMFQYAQAQDLPLPDTTPEQVSKAIRDAECWLNQNVQKHFGAMFAFPVFYGCCVEYRIVFSLLEECDNLQKNKDKLDIPSNSLPVRELLYTDKNKTWVEKEFSKISQDIHVFGFDTNGISEDGEHFVLAVSCVWDLQN